MRTDDYHGRVCGVLLCTALLVAAWALPMEAGARQVTGEHVAPALQQGEQRATNEGALFLLLPSGAQGVGLGRAMTAMSSSESAFWNPAGLARLSKSRVTVFRGEHLAGEATGFSAVHVRPGLGTFGISYELLDVGTQSLIDGSGNVLGSITVRNHQAIISGAMRVKGLLELGANVKLIQFRQSCRGQCIDSGISATSYAFDLGVQGRPLQSRPLTLGMMLAHLGPDFRVEDSQQADPLPARIRVAAGYELLEGWVEEDLTFTLIVEAEDRVRDLGDPSLYLGGEFLAGAVDQVFIRAGYILGDRHEIDGAAVGFGVRYERFELGIARSLARGGPAAASEPVHVTLGLSF
jgi:hypothetical protein